MEKQEIKSKWDELARELGAEVPPETAVQDISSAARVEQQIAAPVGQPSEPRAKPRPAPPKRSAPNWDALTSELGLEPPPAPPAPPAPEPSRVEPVRPTAYEPPRTEKPRTESRPPREPESREPRPRESREVESGREGGRERRPRQEDSRERRPRREDQRESRESKEPRTRREEGRERGGRRQAPRERSESAPRREDQREPGRRREPAASEEAREVEDRDVADMVKTGRRAAEAAESAAEEKPVEPPKAASVSLWHKIFGLPTEQTAKLSGSTTDAEQAETTAEARRPMEGGWEEEFERPAQREPGEEAEAKVEREFDTDQRGKEPTTEEGRGRRPRRRRRGRKPDEERGEPRPAPRARRAPSRTSEEEADESFDFDDEFGGAPAGQQEFAAPTSFDEDADESELEEDFDEGGKPSSGRAAGHRNIPSWEDAIGAIVDHNLQSRTQRKQSGHPSGRGGPSRGRPRGGRRRNKP